MPTVTRPWSTYTEQQAEAAPLAVFRIVFGLLMVVSMIRFWANGWIEKIYLQPSFFFSYTGFEWVKPIGVWTYGLFLLCGLSAFCLAIGYRYRWSAVLFFLSFTYIELMDKTTYLNHYYFVSLVAFLLVLLPAGSYYSVDAWRQPHRRFQRVPAWSIHAIKLLLCIVYFYAGMAKLNSDWLLHAQPLQTWLSTKTSTPLIGPWMSEKWVHYLFSWGGMLYDLTIPFLLLWRPTRNLAFVAVVGFHVMTRILFPIGMFPFIMIGGALIFFDARVHHRWLGYVARLLRINKGVFDNGLAYRPLVRVYARLLVPALLTLFFFAQLLLPFRYLAAPGELFWTEQGYRFSWRVMLMEKAGYIQFKVRDTDTGREFYANNSDFLTAFQEKQMSTQPDFILEFARYLEQHYKNEGIRDPAVYADSYVSLNGRGSQLYVDPKVDLTQASISSTNRTWVLPFKDEIKGL